MKSSGDHAALHQDWRWRWWVVATGADLGCWRWCDDGGGVMEWIWLWRRIWR